MDRDEINRKHEAEQKEMEREERERERAFELEKLKLEQQRMDLELKAKSTGVDLNTSGLDGEKKDSSGAQQTKQSRGVAKGPKMPCFDEEKDNMDAFLHRFEIYAESQGWKVQQWVVYLSALLNGRALEVYSRLAVKEAQSYERLKDALLKRFNLTEEGFKKKFRTAKSETNEAPAQFISRLESYLMRWIDLADVKKDFDGLKNLIVREQYLKSCPVHLAIFLRERKLEDLKDLAKLAEQYLEAHENKVGFKRPEVSQSQETQIKTEERNVQPNVLKRCFSCGKPGHISRNCIQARRAAAMSQAQFGDETSYMCYGQDPIDSVGPETDGGGGVNFQQQTARVMISGNTQGMTALCRAHKQEMCGLCFDYPGHQCSALLRSEVELRCGCVIPVIADACRSGRQRMPVREGTIGDAVVSVLRDTGCSTVVLRRSLVSDDQLPVHNKHAC